MRHHELREGGGAVLAAVASTSRRVSLAAREPKCYSACSPEVSAKAPSASEPGIGRTYEIFSDIMRHHELRESGGAVLAAVASTRKRVSLAAREPKCYSECSPEVG
jgi:hypothetical protein